MSTAEAALGRVGRVGVGEHDEGVAGRQVSPIARHRENGSNLPLRKAEEPSPSSSCNFVHVFILAACVPAQQSTRLIESRVSSLAMTYGESIDYLSPLPCSRHAAPTHPCPTPLSRRYRYVRTAISTPKHIYSAMSGIPPSQAAAEAAKGFQRDPFRPGDRVSKASASAAAADGGGGTAARGKGGGSPSHLVVLGEKS